MIIDVVSTLRNDPCANDSDAKSSDSMQTWLLSLRRAFGASSSNF